MEGNISFLSQHNILPKYTYHQEEFESVLREWAQKSGRGESYEEKIFKIFRAASIEERHLIAPLKTLFTKRDISTVSQYYIDNAIELGTAALKGALENGNIAPKEIDYLITTSCTGFMIPSFDAYLVDKLNLKRSVKRLPITEVGCTAGATSYIYAYDFLKAYPDKKVAIVNLEFPSNTIQLDDFSIENVVGTSIFADGVSCSILGENKTKNPSLRIVDTNMFQVSNTTDLLGYYLVNSGLKMKLDKNLPNVVAENLEKIVGTFLKKQLLHPKKVDRFLIHPGGIAILDAIDKVLSSFGKNVNESRVVFQKYGNLSSATLGFIVEEYLNTVNKNKKEKVIMIGFGPGISAHQLYMEWR